MKQLTALVVSLLSCSAFAAQQPRDAFLEEALFAGGAQDMAELDRLVALFHARIDPIVNVVKDQPPQIAAQLLLKHLHVSYGGTTAVLKEYVLHQWSVKEALETGNYNCLSASVLFIAAARQAGLNATGELYPRHARAVVFDQGVTFRVEATDATGFDAGDWFYYAQGQRGSLAPLLGVHTPTGTGDELMMLATWFSAGQVRDTQWASKVAPTPPPLVSAFSFAPSP